MISMESILCPFRVAVLRLCHDLFRLALHARDRLERPRRVALGRHLDVDYGAVRVSGGEFWAVLVIFGKNIFGKNVLGRIFEKIVNRK